MVPALARQFLAEVEPGARLPTVRALAHGHRSSSSSVHAAIGRLEQAGAIEIETRGRAGAFLVRRSIDRLWAMMKTGPLVIALPLASSPRYEALATAIKQLMTKSGAHWPIVDDVNAKFDWGVTGPPESFIVDPKGIVEAHIVGQVNANQLDNLLGRLEASGTPLTNATPPSPAAAP